MARVERVSSMVEGVHCTVIVNGYIKYFPVHSHGEHDCKYIKLNGRRYFEKDLPFGIEVEI